MVLGPDFSPRRLSIGYSRQERSPLTGGGISPPTIVTEIVGVASEGGPAHSFRSLSRGC